MTKRRGGFVEKFLFTNVGYIHMNISFKNIFWKCAIIPWNLMLSIGRKYMADPVQYYNKSPKQDYSKSVNDFEKGWDFFKIVFFFLNQWKRFIRIINLFKNENFKWIFMYLSLLYFIFENGPSNSELGSRKISSPF